MPAVLVGVASLAVLKDEVRNNGTGLERANIDYLCSRLPLASVANHGKLLWQSGALSIRDVLSSPGLFQRLKIALVDDTAGHAGLASSALVSGTIPAARRVAFGTAPDALLRVFPFHFTGLESVQLGRGQAIRRELSRVIQRPVWLGTSPELQTRHADITSAKRPNIAIRQLSRRWPTVAARRYRDGCPAGSVVKRASVDHSLNQL